MKNPYYFKKDTAMLKCSNRGLKQCKIIFNYLKLKKRDTTVLFLIIQVLKHSLVQKGLIRAHLNLELSMKIILFLAKSNL